MKSALLAAIAAFGVSFGAQALQFPSTGVPPAASSTGECGGMLWHAADRSDEPVACCSHAVGCAHFLATTRVQVHRVPPRT